MSTPRPGGAAAPTDPTAPLGGGSGDIDSALTGPGSDGSSGPLFGDANSALAGLQNPAGAPAQTDYTGTYHHITEQDYKQNQVWDKSVGDGWAFGPVSHNDLDRMHFGIAEPAKLIAAQDAHAKGQQQLDQLASTVNGGDIEAIGTADDILEPGEAGLQFFQFFAPAYNEWTGGGITYDAAKQAYQAEYGMSFADYAADSTTMADLSQQLVSIQQGLNNSYNSLVPTWQGAAASNFEAKMAALFTASSTVTQDVATAGKDVAALVSGLQQLVLAKAQTVGELYADTLPNGIDGVMAQSLVKVAQGQGDERMNLTAFMLLGGTIDPQSLLDSIFDPFGELELKLQAASMAPQMATQWCNAVLVPQFEGREQALDSVNTETTSRIQKGFAAFTGQLNGIADPFTAMAEAKAPTPAGSPTQPAGVGGPSGGTGAPSVGGGTVPSGVGGGDPATVPVATLATPGSATDPTATGEVPGTAGTTTQGYVPPAGPAGDGHHTDISHNRDGSISLGADRDLTISPEHRKHGAFRLTSTDPDGTTHTYRVHFDKHGNPVVKEIHRHDSGFGGAGEVTGPAADLSGGVGGGSGGGGVPSGIGGPADTHPAGSGAASGAASQELSQGAEVGADNTMGATNAANSASPVAGSAAAAAQQSGAHAGGGFGAMPMGAGMGRGAGGEQESARRYQQHGDIVGDEDVEQWQLMGPVIGE